MKGGTIEGYLTVQEVAERFQVSTNTVGRWCRQDRFPGAIKVAPGRRGVWLIPEVDLVGFTKPKPGPEPKPKQ